jgi:hypothetical protein
VAGLREVHRHRGGVDRREGDGDADGVDTVGYRMAVVVVDGHEALRVPKSFARSDRLDAGEGRDDDRAH